MQTISTSFGLRPGGRAAAAAKAHAARAAMDALSASWSSSQNDLAGCPDEIWPGPLVLRHNALVGSRPASDMHGTARLCRLSLPPNATCRVPNGSVSADLSSGLDTPPFIRFPNRGGRFSRKLAAPSRPSSVKAASALRRRTSRCAALSSPSAALMSCLASCTERARAPRSAAPAPRARASAPRRWRQTSSASPRRSASSARDRLAA